MTTTATLEEPADALFVLSMDVGCGDAGHGRSLVLGVSMSALSSPTPVWRAVWTCTVSA